ncbi:uncharacterized protein EDB91DRAFT_1084978 [Suillus paluster]|uniref:uncharacterized protein n=1 Tax=Suillus paluster TaxID=48578 RepID=UPI001B85B8CA|nr:uncharacterized protein EDB91DRAFT_1084978 [Suillus paluster]KAG1731617.1 hypothetical protein EDB91DRAFT_1084978 [Suillus paluster]
MSEALFKFFAIVCAGPHIGIPIVKVFLAIDNSILVIARPTSTDTSALFPDDDSSLKGLRNPSENKVGVLISIVTLVFGGVLVMIRDAEWMYTTFVACGNEDNI